MSAQAPSSGDAASVQRGVAQLREPSAKYLVRAGYKQTEVGFIPAEWDAGTLGRFWGVTDCKHVTATFVSQGIPVASIREVQSRFVDLKGAKQTTAHFYDLLVEGGRKPRPGDLIVSRNATVGEVAQVADWHPPFAMGQDVCLLRKRASNCSTDFLQALIQSPIVLNQLTNLMVGSTFKRANVEQLRNLAVPMPPALEQHDIGDVLSDIDALLAGLDRLIAKKRDLKQAAMQQLLTGHTRLPGFQGEWESKCIGDFTDCTAGGTPSTSIAHYWGGSIRWMSSGELNQKQVYEVEGRITESGLANSSTKVIPAKCVLIGLAGQGKTRGTVAINHIELCTNQSIAAIFPNTSFVSEYLYYNLDARYEELRELSAGDGGRGGLNLRIIRSVAMPFPSLEEQAAIATILSDMDAELSALEARRDKTRALKQGMMQELLTGRTRLV